MIPSTADCSLRNTIVKNDVTYLISEAEHYLKDRYADMFSEESWKAQRSVMEPLYRTDSSDVLGILPTGMGKSFIYQYYARNLDGTVLVIEPLNAIINDQVQRYNSEYGNGAFHLKRLQSDTKTEITSQDLKDIDPDLIYASPETLYNCSHDIIKIFGSKSPRGLSMIVIDEAHTLLDWGLSFRDDYLFVIKFIREIRKKYNVRLLLLTATLNKMQSEYLKCYLGLNLTVYSVTRPLPSKDKVKVESDWSSDDDRYKPIINNLDKTKEEGCTLLFFATTNEVRTFYSRLNNELENLEKRMNREYDVEEEKKSDEMNAKYPDYTSIPATSDALETMRGRPLLKGKTGHSGVSSFLLDVENTVGRQAVVATFYGLMTPQEKDERLDAIRSFRSNTGENRTEIVYILTTKALSMGIDIDAVTQVINIGFPDSMSEYKQEIGRIRNPDDNTTYTVFCTQKERQQVLNRLLSPEAARLDTLTIVSARIKFWDYLSLCNWFQNGQELPDMSLNKFLKIDSDSVIKIVEDLFPKCSDLRKERVQLLFGDPIKKEQIRKEAGKTQPRFLMHTSEVVMSVFGLNKGNYKCADDKLKLNFFDYIVFNSIFTLARQEPGMNLDDPDRKDTLASELFSIMLGSIKPPRKDKENKERDEIISLINCSLDKLLDCEIICTLNNRRRKLIDTSILSFPLTDNLKNAMIIGFTRSQIGSVIAFDKKRTKITLPKLIAVYYTLLEVEMARRFFFVKIKNIKNTSYKAKYFPTTIIESLDLKNGTPYHKYQLPDQFRKYMQESLVAIYKEETKRIEGYKCYIKYSHKSPKEIYDASAENAYGLLSSKAPQKAQENYDVDKTDNLIINRCWLIDNGKIKKKEDEEND